jgi:hypothetical protein
MAVSGLYAWHLQADFCSHIADPSCKDTTTVKPGEVGAANGDHDHATYIATPMFIVGAVAFAAGVVLYVTAADKERVQQTVLAPVVAPDRVGFALTGSF